MGKGSLARPATIPRARVAETGQKRFPIIGISGTLNKSNRCGNKEPNLMKLTLLTALLLAPSASFFHQQHDGPKTGRKE